MDRPTCGYDHRKSIICYCNKCEIFCCEECVISEHYDHIPEISELENVLKNEIADYKKLKRLVDLKEKVALKQKESLEDLKSIYEERLQRNSETLVGKLIEEKDKITLDIKANEELSKAILTVKGGHDPRIDGIVMKLDNALSVLNNAISEKRFLEGMKLIKGKEQEELQNEYNSLINERIVSPNDIFQITVNIEKLQVGNILSVEFGGELKFDLEHKSSIMTVSEDGKTLNSTSGWGTALARNVII